MVSIRISLGRVERSGRQVNSGVSAILVLRGVVTLRSPEQNRTLSENHYAVLNHNDIYTLDSNGPNVFLWVNIEQSWLESVCPEEVNSRYQCCSTVSNPATQPLFDAIRQRLIRAAMLRYRQEEGCELLLQAELLQALYTLSLHFRAGTQMTAPVGASDRLKPVLEFMQRNFREPITLENVARSFYMSDAHLKLWENPLRETLSPELYAEAMALLCNWALRCMKRRGRLLPSRASSPPPAPEIPPPPTTKPSAAT